MAYGVWCVVSGGLTGRREAWMKGWNGEVAEFATKAEAEERATGLNEKMNNAYSVATFSYTARELPDYSEDGETALRRDADDDEDELDAPM